jgi:hypothetical protein
LAIAPTAATPTSISIAGATVNRQLRPRLGPSADWFSDAAGALSVKYIRQFLQNHLIGG